MKTLMRVTARIHLTTVRRVTGKIKKMIQMLKNPIVRMIPRTTVMTTIHSLSILRARDFSDKGIH